MMIITRTVISVIVTIINIKTVAMRVIIKHYTLIIFCIFVHSLMNSSVLVCSFNLTTSCWLKNTKRVFDVDTQLTSLNRCEKHAETDYKCLADCFLLYMDTLGICNLEIHIFRPQNDLEMSVVS